MACIAGFQSERSQRIRNDIRYISQTLAGSCRKVHNWRKAIEQHLGGIEGCAHLRELLFNMATAGFQTMVQSVVPIDPEHPPPHLGKCVTWDFNGPVVARRYPKFYRLQVQAPTDQRG